MDYYGYFPRDKELNSCGNFYRPKSLQGIEDNCGWIKIESESDLPKKDSECFFIEHGNITQGIFNGKRFISNYGVFGWKTITYHQPIEKPKPPIY